MSDDHSPLAALFVNFAILSVFAVGGINATIPEMHRQAVEVHHWMNDQRFADLFAISQAAPGPNAIIVTLIGWEVAGLTGALVGTLAIVGPTSILTYFVGHLWHRFRFARWRIAIQAGLAPITIGLVGASTYLLALVADTSIGAIVVTLGTAAILYRTRIHPLILFALAAALGALGVI